MARTNRARILLLCLLITAVMVSALAGCKKEPAEPTGKDKEGGTAIWRLPAEPATLNPLLGGDGASGLVARFMGETLGGVDFDGSWDGRLATSYTASADGLTYTFKLRQGVKWHDGQPFTADDVVFTFGLVMNEALTSPFRSRFVLGGKPVTWEKVDQYTVNMKLPQKSAVVIEHLRNVMIVPQHLLKDVKPEDFKTCDFNRNPVLTGPFKFVEYKSAEYVKMVRFDDYWGGKPYLDGIVLRIVPDEAAAVVALETDQLDQTGVSEDTFLRMKDKGTVSLYNGPSTNIYLIHPNNKLAPFDDVKVRQALNHALNRTAIVENVFHSLAKPEYTFMSSVVIYHNEDIVQKYAFDLEKAKKLLAEAGFVAGQDGVLARDGKKLDFEISYMSSVPAMEKALLIYQQDLSKIGIKMTPRALESSAIVASITAGTDPLPYSVIFNRMGPGYDPDGYGVVYHGGGYPSGKNGWNYIGYTNDEVDDLFDQGQTEVDSAKRAQIYGQIQKIVSEDAAIIPVVCASDLQITTKRLQIEESGLQPGAPHRWPHPEKLWIKKTTK